MFIYSLISLRIRVRDYKRLCVFMFIPVLVSSALWIFPWINLDLVLGPRTRKFIFPIHLDHQDRRPQHLENLLGDRVPNVIAGRVVSLLTNTFFVLNVVDLNVV